MSELIPIFPLQVVVYPGDALNLHIFEPRYQQLTEDCAATDRPFGVPTVVAGKMGGLGTLVRLLEVTNVQADGQCDVRTQGLRVFQVRRLLKTYPGKLYGAAEVEWLESAGTRDAETMKTVLAGIRKLHALLNITKQFPKPDAELTSFDVAHHAGMSLEQAYELLGLAGEPERERYLQRHLERVLPVVAEMELLKEKIRLNGHFKILPGLDF
jgi:Lon protease-like protein